MTVGDLRAASDITCDINTISAAARELRDAAGLSPRDLARAVGTSQPAIVRLELGGGMPRLDTLERVADALGADLGVALRKRSARPRRGRAEVRAAHVLLTYEGLVVVSPWR